MSALLEHITPIEKLFKKGNQLWHISMFPRDQEKRQRYQDELEQLKQQYHWLINQALIDFEYEPLLWFRRAWGHHIFQEGINGKASFEEAERDYLHIIDRLDVQFGITTGPAYLMLLELYTAEIRRQATQQLINQDFTDYGPVIISWGKVAEVALKHAFLEPYIKHAQANSVRSPRKNVQNWRWSDIEKLLDSASKESVLTPVRQFLNESGLESSIWTQKIPKFSKELRHMRNPATHGTDRSSQSKASEARAILFTRGFLAEIGEALRKMKGHRP